MQEKQETLRQARSELRLVSEVGSFSASLSAIPLPQLIHIKMIQSYIINIYTTRTGRACDYSTPPQVASESEISALQRRVQELEEHVRQFPAQMPSSVSCSGPVDSNLAIQAYYLDSEAWSSLKFPDRSAQILAPDDICAALGGLADIDSIKAGYFQSIHVWFPFVSKIRMNRITTQVSQSSLKGDIALLLLCMKLIQEVPGNRQSRQSLELYKLAKEFSKKLELEGLLTLSTVQAGVLLLLYELGHGIFPAAFMTISYCARQGVALGIHNKLAPQLYSKPRFWGDWEERQRVWWAIIILDRLGNTGPSFILQVYANPAFIRYVAIGGDYRPLCTDDPGSDTLLPVDDDAWNSGVSLAIQSCIILLINMLIRKWSLPSACRCHQKL